MPTVTFYSDRFSDTPAADAINEMLGKDLSEWLREELNQRGFEVGEVIAEDYGYGFWLLRNRSHYWITQTQLDPGDDQDERLPQWLIGMDYDPGCLWIWRLRVRPASGDLTAITQAVQAIIQADASIHGVEWDGLEVDQGDLRLKA